MGEKRNTLTCLIIGAAPCHDFDYIKSFYKEADCVICADGGAQVAKLCGIDPDYWIGDGDSLSVNLGTSNQVILPCEKDYTDLQCAVDLALEKGYDRLYLCAVSGGRLDHFMANLYLLEYIEERGAVGVLADAQNLCFMHCGGEMLLERQADFKYVSLIPLDRELIGVTLKGLKYPLENATLTRTVSIGISNEAISEHFSVKIDSGHALIVYSKDVSK